jgi:hypothetical protein
MTKTISEILSAAADLIEPEGCWTQRAYCRNADGKALGWGSDEAVCWCITGATGTVDEEGCGTDADRFLRRLLKSGVSLWNDAPERTQAEVVATLREAAAKAKEIGL